MPPNKLRVVALSLIVSRVLYAISSWGGFLSVDLIGRIDTMCRRLKRYGNMQDNLKLSELLGEADREICLPICADLITVYII